MGYLCLFMVLVGLAAAKAEQAASPSDPTPPDAEKSPDTPKQPPGEKLSAGTEVAGRLIDQDPYDRIFLDAANNHAVLEVFPLELPGRQVPERPTQPLIVRLLNRPETKYEVAWSAVVKIEFFEQRVLQEAQQLVEQARFEEAYEYFQYLYQHYPKMSGLEPAYQDALWREAAHWYQQGQYDRALAVLRTLWERKKDRPNLDRAMGMAVERLVQQYVSAEDYESARAMLRQLAHWYPEHPLVAKWEEQFRTQAASLQAKAKDALANNALREAFEAARKMIQLCPTLPGAQELWQEVRHKYPRVVVGVSLPIRPEVQPSSVPLLKQEERSMVADRIWWAERADWAAWRTDRLLARQWMELLSPGSEGGQYRFPVGTFRIEDLGRRLLFQLQPNLFDRHGKELTGYRLAEVLLQLADPRSPFYRPEWADRVQSIAVKNIYTVEVLLRRAHVRPEALLCFPIADLPGPYQLLAAQERQTVFVLSPQYFASASSQPKEIVEIHFSSVREALAALRAGKVDLVDRIPPSELHRLQESKEIAVGQYTLPVLHVLVLNPHRPLMANGRFRRALEYGIYREEILAQIYGLSRRMEPLAGESKQSVPPPEVESGKAKPSSRPSTPEASSLAQLPAGFRVLGAPIPIGITHNDPIGYAYDHRQKARSYNPRLSLALAKLSWAEVSGVAQALLESPSAPGTVGTGPTAASPATPAPSASEGKPSAPSSQPPPVQQPPPIPSPKTEPLSPKEPSTPQPSSKQPAKAEHPPPEKKTPPDPFAEESPEEKPSPRPSAKPSPEESAPASEKPGTKQTPPSPAKPKPSDKAPADPFSEGASVHSQKKESLTNFGGSSWLWAVNGVGWWGFLAEGRSAGADPFAESSASPASGSSKPTAGTENSAGATRADPFAEEASRPKSETPASEKPTPSPGQPAPEQPPKPSVMEPSPKKITPTPKLPASGEKVSGQSKGPVGPEKPSVKVSAEEKPSISPPGPVEKPRDYLLDMPPLVLVHPPTESARMACRQIRRMLRRVGIPVQLQEVHPAELFGPRAPEFDLAYVELVIQEPVADLPRLLTQTTSAGLSSSFLALGLAELYQAPGWPEVRQALYRIHQITAQEVPMVPLWQTVEYFAYRRTLEGIGPRVIRLYENVEQWRIVDQVDQTTLPPSEVRKTPAGSK